MKQLRFHLLFSIIMLIVCSANVQAASDYDVNHINVTDPYFGANGTDQADDYDAIQKALDIAWKENTAITVYIPAGTYYINDMLEIYSNTTLKVDPDAYIKNTSNTSDAMLCCSHRDENGNFCGHNVPSCTHGGHSQWSNIVVDGGTWDAGVTKTSTNELISCLKAEHGYNVTVRNGKYMNTNIHILNFSASQKVFVENCRLQNNMADDKKFPDTDEALHLDYTDVINEPEEYPHDKTPVDDVTIRNCTFYDVGCAIGAHSTTDVYVGTNILIENNTFIDVECNAINMYANKGVTVRNNVMYSNLPALSWSFLYTVFGEVTMTGNQVSNVEAVWVKGSLISTFPVIMDSGNSFTKYCICRYAADINSPSKYKDIVTTGQKYKVRGNPFRKPGYRFMGWYAYNPLRNVWKATIKQPTKWLSLDRINAATTYGLRIYAPGERTMNLIPYHHYTVLFIAKWQKKEKLSLRLSRNSFIYNGKKKKPAVTVYEGKKVLSKKYYRVQYKKNKKPGTAKVIITGKGYYKGERISKTFKIKKKSGGGKSRKFR